MYDTSVNEDYDNRYESYGGEHIISNNVFETEVNTVDRFIGIDIVNGHNIIVSENQFKILYSASTTTCINIGDYDDGTNTLYLSEAKNILVSDNMCMSEIASFAQIRTASNVTIDGLIVDKLYNQHIVGTIIQFNSSTYSTNNITINNVTCQ